MAQDHAGIGRFRLKTTPPALEEIGHLAIAREPEGILERPTRDIADRLTRTIAFPQMGDVVFDFTDRNAPLNKVLAREIKILRDPVGPIDFLGREILSGF